MASKISSLRCAHGGICPHLRLTGSVAFLSIWIQVQISSLSCNWCYRTNLKQDHATECYHVQKVRH